MSRRSPYVALLVLLAVACTDKPRDGAIRLELRYPSFTPGCVLITATDAVGGEAVQLPLERGALKDRSRSVVAVARKPTWSTSINLKVAAFESDCTSARSGTPVELHQTEAPLTLAPNQITDWRVELTSVDVDGDGYIPMLAPQGTDCNDGSPAINPGQKEDCSGSLDADCDGLPGCADPDCAAASCNDGDGCTEGDRCSSEGQCVGAPKICQSAAGCGGSCSVGMCRYEASAGSTCSSGLCRSDGSCGPGEAICNNGLDDDRNGLADCADPACLTQRCEDGDGCTDNDVCQVGGACGGSPKVCNTAPSSCHQEAGTCNAGSCVYPVRLNAPCATDKCLMGQRCAANGSCGGGVPIACNNPPSEAQCHNATGTCNPSTGTCSYALRTNAACNDSMACTRSDTCLADGACRGTAYTCTPTSECVTSACNGTGGCVETAKPVGTPCTGGSCTRDGACAPVVSFGFTPLTVGAASAAHQPSGPVVLEGCYLRFDSTGTNGFSGSDCTGRRPAVYTFSDPALGPISVLAMSSLRISATGVFRIFGPNPVVLLVYGDAQIDGTLSVSSSTVGGFVGAGANRSGCGDESGNSGEMPRLTNDRGGGGGGGHASPGGFGGNDFALIGRDVGEGGAAAPVGPVVLRGGCPGGSGHGSPNTLGGSGGGAMQLSAAGALRCTGLIAASGGGGRGGTAGGGGSGGGAGGTLMLEASNLLAAGACRIMANGGAGGGGAGPGNGTATNGADGRPEGQAAIGGTATAQGGNGGQGGSATSIPGDGLDADRGGGGGGGSAGRILVGNRGNAACQLTSQVSPAPTRANCP
jgi:hypothetical protein